MSAVLYQTTYNIVAVRGDTLGPIVIRFDRVGFDFTGASFFSQVRKPSGSLISSLVVNSSIPLLGSILAEISQTPAIMADFPIGKWEWDLELTYLGGRVRTYVGGDFTVVKDWSYV